MAKIHFKPANVSIEVRDGTTVFAAALAAEVAIPSQCGGRCACALCRVRIVQGAERVSPMQWEEASHMGNCFHLTGERLSCQSRVYGEVVVEIDEIDAAERPRSRYIPPSLIRKREKMEQEEELRRVRGTRSSPGATGSSAATGRNAGKSASAKARGARDGSAGLAGDAKSGDAAEKPAGRAGRGRSRSSSRRRRKGRSRNPGTLKPGQTRAPPGARGGGKSDDSAGSS